METNHEPQDERIVSRHWSYRLRSSILSTVLNGIAVMKFRPGCLVTNSRLYLSR